jgi:uncharacterized protein (DUF3084 family)
MGSSGIILILAVLVLGGVIATVGDRIGTRVGKARLSLFNLRPKKTAVLVTILTGTLISASTLGILLAADKQLRDGLLRLKTIKDQFNATKDALESTKQQKSVVQAELDKAKVEQTKANRELTRINQSLKTAVERQAITEAQRTQVQAQRDMIQGQLIEVAQRAVALRNEIQRLQTDRQILVERQAQIKAQIGQRDNEIKQRTEIIRQRTEIIEQRDRVIADRDAVLSQKEQTLKQLEGQQAYLDQEVKRLEQAAMLSRLGNLAIQRNQVLATGVAKVPTPADSPQVLDQLLREANRFALQSTQPGINNGNQQIVQLTQQEAQRLLNQISDGQEYVVRIIAAANYYRGEKTAIAVYPDAVLNRVVFQPGDVVAGTLIDPSQLSKQELQKIILEQLPAASGFRARGAGLLNDTVQIQQVQAWLRIIEQLQTYTGQVEIRTVAAEATYTASPLKLGLIARQNGQIILQTQ